MAIHGIYFPDLRPIQRGLIAIGGDEAHHALRVKRVEVGDPVRLYDGRGVVADARVAGSRKGRDGWQMEVEIVDVKEVPRTTPGVWVLAAAPKGDRLEAMVDGLSQVGAVGWSPLITGRTVVDPRQGKLERLGRVAVEAMKQSGRAWALEIGESVEFAAALQRAGRVVMADATGTPCVKSGSAEVTLLIGPEGGWTDSELEQGRAAGAVIARFGLHTMRTELAAVVACAAVLETEHC